MCVKLPSKIINNYLNIIYLRSITRFTAAFRKNWHSLCRSQLTLAALQMVLELWDSRNSVPGFSHSVSRFAASRISQYAHVRLRFACLLYRFQLVLAALEMILELCESQKSFQDFCMVIRGLLRAIWATWNRHCACSNDASSIIQRDLRIKSSDSSSTTCNQSVGHRIYCIIHYHQHSRIQLVIVSSKIHKF